MARSAAMNRVLKARENVANKDKWFADVIYNVPVIETTSIKTMDTNGLCVRFNPDFVMEHTAHVEGVFCHEGWHVILDHVRRRGTRGAMDWNIAADAIINPMVAKRGWTLPDGCVRIPEVEKGKMSAERAYEWIKQQRDAKAEDEQRKATIESGEGEESDEEMPGQSGLPDEQEDDADTGGGEDKDEKGYQDIPDAGSEEMKEPTEEELDEFCQKIERSIESATQRAEKGHYMDPLLKRALAPEATKHELNWKEALEDMVANNRAEDNRTWSRPNRRYLGQGEIRPGYLRDQINRLIVLFDTSGSVNAQATADMRERVAELMELGLISHITIISVDTDIQAMGDVSTAQEVRDFNLNIKRGGTSFGSAMKVVRNIDDTVGVVFLTDMQTNDFGEDPNVPMIWVNWATPVSPGNYYYPPYGRVMDYNPRKDAA